MFTSSVNLRAYLSVYNSIRSPVSMPITKQRRLISLKLLKIRLQARRPWSLESFVGRSRRNRRILITSNTESDRLEKSVFSGRRGTMIPHSRLAKRLTPIDHHYSAAFAEFTSCVPTCLHARVLAYVSPSRIHFASLLIHRGRSTTLTRATLNYDRTRALSLSRVSHSLFTIRDVR